MTAYTPDAFSTFAVALAGAAAALCGLAFVAISFNLDSILSGPTLPGRAGETLIFLAFGLLVGLVLLIPAQPRSLLGSELAALAVALAVVLIRIDLPRYQAEREFKLAWRLWHTVPSVLVLGLCAIGAVGVLTSSLGGLYWIAASVLVSMLAGLFNCWVLLVEIKR